MRSGQRIAYVAFLRGVNVGGKNKLPMADLAELFRDAGCVDVRTYIQSGNVVFRSTPASFKELAETIEERIAAKHGFHSPVILRTRQELERTIQTNPFLQTLTPQRMLHVYFLSVLPNARALASLDPGRSSPDEYAVCGREVYLKLPNGMARTKLTNAYFDSRLSTISTARNWNTALRLYDLMQEPASASG